MDSSAATCLLPAAGMSLQAAACAAACEMLLHDWYATAAAAVLPSSVASPSACNWCSLQAKLALENLKNAVDTLIIIPNDRLLSGRCRASKWAVLPLMLADAVNKT